MYFLYLLLSLPLIDGLKILQIVPGFTNSHVLFNYRLAQTLTNLGHEVKLWTQMEMAMLDTGNNKLPKGAEEMRIPIYFKDTLKLDGLKVFQSMIFNSGNAYELWWTGQEFRSMRVEACEQMLNLPEEVFEKWRAEAFDLAIAHFHDACPLLIADRLGVSKTVWITHGTSVYDWTAVSLGFSLSFVDRLFNLAWHLSSIDFVNLPQNLLDEEYEMYERLSPSEPNIWDLSRRVSTLFINGDRMLDFPRPFPFTVTYTGELGRGKDESATIKLPSDIEEIVNKAEKGIILFSLGTVSNTTNMPERMIKAFVDAFARVEGYSILWRMESTVPGSESIPHLHLLKWLPQRDLMRHPKTRLLIAHGGYNSLLESSQAAIPVLLMPLFADQKINAQRALRYGIGLTLDKHTVTAEDVYSSMQEILHNERFKVQAQSLSSILSTTPSSPSSSFNYMLRVSLKDPSFFSLETARHLPFFSFYSLPQLLLFPLTLLTLLSI